MFTANYSTMLKVCMRCFHTSYPVCDNLSKTMGKFLNKGASNKKRKVYNDFMPKLPSTQSLTRTKYEHAKSSQRRINVLKKLFMSHISDQLLNTSIVSLIEGKGFEITRLKISTDFGLINVYWSTTKVINEEKFQEVLKHVAGLLRHELSQLKIMGNIPKIQFVKDKYFIQLMELDRSLAKADFGEDYLPNKSTEALKSELSLNMVLDAKILKKVKEIDIKYNDIIEYNIPEMSHNVFGLDREKIINKIQKGKDSSVYAWSNFNTDDTTITAPEERVVTNINILNSSTVAERKSRRAEFEEFLKNRDIMRNKLIEELSQYENKAQVVSLTDDFTEDNFEEPEDKEFEDHICLNNDDYEDYDYDDKITK